MQVICTVIFASLFSVQALIMPVVKPDGSLDISSLVSHILLLERTVEKVQSELQTSRIEQKVTQSKLDTALDDLKDLSHVKTELAVLQSKIQSGIFPTNVTRLDSELQAARAEQKVTESKLETALNDLQVLSNVTTSLGVLQNQMVSWIFPTNITRLDSELKAAQKEQKVMQSKLDLVLNDLKDLSNVTTDLAVLQSQMQSVKGRCYCASLGNSGSQAVQDLSAIQSDVFTLKSEVKKLQSLTNKTDIPRLSSDMSIIRAEIFHLQSLHNRSTTPQGNSVYTRWGRTSCSTGNNLLYRGFAAGTNYSDPGGSASTLCLPEQPIYSNATYVTHDNYASQIWGVEYNEPYSTMPFQPLDQEDMPCVVCESNRATSIMVPARNACYQGWTLEYSGILMGGYKTYSTADYMCLDTDAEVIPGGHEALYGRLLYPVVSKCGSLVCPPYIDDKIITCVVCSK